MDPGNGGGYYVKPSTKPNVGACPGSTTGGFGHASLLIHTPAPFVLGDGIEDGDDDGAAAMTTCVRDDSKEWAASIPRAP